MEKIRERDLTWQIEEFMICCKSKDLRRKTMQSYEQTLRLFERWCRESHGICTVDERLTIRQRQREGIDSAKEKGKHLGRPKASLPDNYNDVICLW